MMKHDLMPKHRHPEGHCGRPHGAPEGPCPGPGRHHHGPHHDPHHGHHHGNHHEPRPEKMRAFAQSRLLSLLLEHEEGVRQKYIAEEMHINPSSTSELIGKLEAEGYIVRAVDPDDKRATLITLTEVGRARAYELEDERAERFTKFFVNLADKEKEQLLKLLEKLTEAPTEE